MSDLLRELVGREVSVWPKSDTGIPGILQDISGRWIHLVSGSDGALLIPTCNIRLIKIAGGMTAQSATGGLLPSLLGRTVSVSSSSGEGSYSDTGELQAFDDDWLRVGVKGAQLYFPVNSITEIRLVHRQI